MTKRHFYYLGYTFFLFLIESAARKVFAQDFFFVPQFLLLIIIVVAIKLSFQESVWVGFFAGFLLEIFSGQAFGGYIFALLLTSALFFLITRKITTQDISPVGSALLVLAGTFFFISSLYLYNGFFSLLGLGGQTALRSVFSSKIFWTAAINLMAFYPVKFIFDILQKRSEKSL